MRRIAIQVRARHMMMLVGLFLFVSSVQAVTVRVIGKGQQLLFRSEKAVELPSNVGKISLELFEQKKIPYEGGVFGFSSLYGLGQDMEVISDVEMKAFGWCYSVNGVVPETMADQTSLDHQDAVIEWFYAYAHYLSGEWIGQCVRSL